MKKTKYVFEEIKKEYDKKFNEGLKKTGIFWAFSKEQFDENKTHKDAPNEDYLPFFGGGYIHKDNKDKLDNFLKNEAPKLDKEFISKVKMEDFIKYELINHECYYIGDFTEVALIMKSYYKEMSEKEIYDKVKSVYDSVREKSYSDIDEGSIGIYHI